MKSRKKFILYVCVFFATLSIITTCPNFIRADENDSDKSDAQIYEQLQTYENEHVHAYELSFKWASDYSTCTAQFVCKDCGESFTENCTVKSEKTDATCTKDGKTVYTASVNYDGQTYSDSKTVTVKATGHTYDSGKTSGNKKVYTCKTCGATKTEYIPGVYKSSNGNWYYYGSDGNIDKSYTGFATNSNGKWWIDKGQVTFKKQGILKDEKGALGSKSNWYYVIDSKVQTSFTGLSNFSNSNGWWYIKKGQVDFSAHGVYKNCNGWYYVDGGKVQFNYNGFASNSNGKWYINNGKVTFKTKDILKDSTGEIGSKGAWYYVIDSKVQTGFTGLSNFSNKNGWWYIKNGKVDFSHNGVDKNKNGWWYVTDGKVQFGFTGLANYKNSNGWWYIKNGKVDFNHSGVDKNKNGWYYTSGGKVDFSHNGVEKNSNGWWVIRNGRVNFDYTGLAANKNGVWYCKDSKVQFGANGSKTVGGIKYKCSGGKVTISSSSLITGGSSSVRSKCNSALTAIPANIMASLVNKGEKIKLVDKFSWSGHDKYAGVTSGTYIELRNSASGVSTIVAHEVGHSFDWLVHSNASDKAYPSESSEFKNIMTSEISKYRSTFRNKGIDSDLLTGKDVNEYFADAFGMYCRYPSDLKKNCPKTYNYITNQIYSLDYNKNAVTNSGTSTNNVTLTVGGDV